MQMRKSLVSVSGLMFLAQPTWAQATASPIGQADADTQSATSSQTTDEAGGVEDIVVTAQRRDERLQDVPIAISAVTAAAALRSGVTGTESLTVAVPSLQFSRQIANGGAPFIRGVGSGQAAQGSESPIADYVDDVYIGSPGATALSFNNVERIEVLKGPQGTLFGRNATGGVVHVRTRRPSHDFALDASAGYANYDTIDGNLYVTGGLTDALAVNFAATGHNQDNGYGLNINTGDDIYKSKYYGVRGEALWEPSDETSLLLIGDYSRTRSDEGLNPTHLPGTISVAGQGFQGRYRGSAVPTDTSLNTQYGFSGRLDHDFGGVRLASITAYRRNDLDYGVDVDGAVANVLRQEVHGRNKTFSEELQLLSPTGQDFQWILGAFYFHSRAGYDPVATIGASQAALGGKVELTNFQTLDSYSGFGEVNYKFLPDTKLTLGLRYTSDNYGVDVRRINAAGMVLAPTPFKQSDSFQKLTYRAILDHHFSEDIMAYASYSRGFKSGGFNVAAPTVVIGGVTQPAPAVRPEVLDAYEIGIKTELFDNLVRLNAAAFTYDYKDLQVNYVTAGFSITQNAASAKIRGVDLDFEFSPSRNFSMSGGLAVLDGKFSSFPNGPLTVPNPAVCSPTPGTTGTPTGGNTTCSADLSGNRTPRSPKFTASMSATYTAFSDNGKFALSGSIYRTSSFAWESDNRLLQPAYTLLGASLLWTSPNEQYDVRLWGKNLGNAYYFNFASASAIRDSGSPATPRTYGATLGVHF